MPDLFYGGEGGIRTRGTVAGTTVFKTVSFNHSDTSPLDVVYRGTLYIKHHNLNRGWFIIKI